MQSVLYGDADVQKQRKPPCTAGCGYTEQYTSL